jgi:hypothetical protein
LGATLVDSQDFSSGIASCRVDRNLSDGSRLGAGGQDALANGGGRRYLTLTGSPGG